MELIDRLAAQIRKRETRTLLRQRRCVETACAAHLRVDGSERINFASNDYLGLAAHPRLRAALAEGAARYGAGSGGSALLCGHSRVHGQLEEALAAFAGGFVDTPRALYFCTGYLANLAVLPTLANSAGRRGATIFSDALNHASLIDASRLSQACVQVYPHADTAALAALLAECETPLKLIVSDGVFSMEGDIAPLERLKALAEQYRAWLIVDDAHGFGVLGETGAGVLSAQALRSPHLIYIATLGKAAGVAGAFVVAHQIVIEWLIQCARPYLFSTAPPPALAHAVLESLALIASDEGAARRAQLQQAIARARTLLPRTRWQPLDSNTAIQPLVIGDAAQTLAVARALDAQGLWVPAIRFPSVALGAARLRISLSAGHSEDDLDQLTEALLGFAC